MSLEERKSRKRIRRLETGSRLLQWGHRKCEGGVGNRGKMGLVRRKGPDSEDLTATIVPGMGQHGLKRS